MFVAVRSEHGHPMEVKLFSTEDAARGYARDLSQREGFEDKREHAVEHDGHTHESHWLEDWGDDDGCGVVVGESAAP